MRSDLEQVLLVSRTYALPQASPGGWAMSEEACRFLGAFVQWLRPRRTLEFGSGFSSTVIACELERQAQGVLDSIDSSPRWSAVAAEMTRACRADPRAVFHRFPLGLRVYGGYPAVFYRVPRTFHDERAPYDLAVIDGPHHDVGRDGGLPESFDRLRPGGWVLVDDAKADHMQRTLQRWNEMFGPSIASSAMLDVGNGVVVIRKLATDRRGRLRLPPSRLPRDWLRAGRNLWRVRCFGLNAV